jgi:hypothetical protein
VLPRLLAISRTEVIINLTAYSRKALLTNRDDSIDFRRCVIDPPQPLPSLEPICCEDFLAGRRPA